MIRVAEIAGIGPREIAHKEASSPDSKKKKKKNALRKAKESHKGTIFDSLSNDWEEQVEIWLHWNLSFKRLQRKSLKIVNYTSQRTMDQKS